MTTDSPHNKKASAVQEKEILGPFLSPIFGDKCINAYCKGAYLYLGRTEQSNRN